MTCTCSQRAGRHSAKCDFMAPRIVARAVALNAYQKGFLAGANPGRAYQRHTVGPLDIEKHWRRGFNDGREASDKARTSYDIGLQIEPEYTDMAEAAKDGAA